MDRFAQLFDALEEAQREPVKVAALVSYFQGASSSDAAWVLHFLCGRKISRSVTSVNLRTWGSEVTGMPDWLIEDCFQSVGDLGETLNLLLPKATTPRKWAVKDLIEREILPLSQSVSGGGFRDVFRRLRIGSKISWFSSLRNRIPLDVSS
jgi:DNA ligase-1